MIRKSLIVVHQETSTPGRVGVKLARRGFTLDIYRPCLGHALPPSLEGYSGAVVFGGPMSANDCGDLQFIRQEIDWLAVPLKEQVPYLGICLGAQLLCRHLGGVVSAHPEGQTEIGYYPIRPTAAGAPYGPWPALVYHWHRRGSACRPARCCWPRATPSRIRRFGSARRPSAFSSTRK